MRMHDGEVIADEVIVRRLLRAQFPQWADLSLRSIGSIGTDHWIYRLGEDKCVRLPRIGWAIAQAEKEATWLPRLAPKLSLAVPVPIAMGAASEEYPWPWSVGPWIEGRDAHVARPSDLIETAERLAEFILSLGAIDTAGAPMSSELDLRGAPLSTRDEPTRLAISQIADLIDVDHATAMWDQALAVPEWHGPPTWHHGDLLPGNLLIRNERIIAVI